MAVACTFHLDDSQKENDIKNRIEYLKNVKPLIQIPKLIKSSIIIYVTVLDYKIFFLGTFDILLNLLKITCKN